MTPDAKQILLENFDYDLWANLKWLTFLQESGDEREREVFAHVLMAGSLWALRVSGNSPLTFPEVPLEESQLRQNHATWLKLIHAHDWQDVIAYRRTTGEEMALPFGEIALHVANHGTYHRGHMRGLCQARGCASFPETDRMLFSLERMPDSP